MDFLPWLMIVGVGAIVITAVAAGRVYARRRREAMERVAAQHGYQFDPNATGVLDSDFASCRLFGLGHSRRASNLVHKGTGGADVLAFDYRYVIGGGKNRSVHSQTVIVAPLPGAKLPRFEVRPENVFHKIGSAFGYQDIDFVEYPEFSSRFLVRGTDEQAVRSVFTQSVIYALQSVGKICVEGGGDWLVIYRSRRRIKPHELMQALDNTRAIVAAFAKRH